MVTILSLLMIWMVIIPSKAAFGMEAPPLSRSIAEQSNSQSNANLPRLYCEDALKKARKEGYRKGMSDSNQAMVILDAQRQQIYNKYLDREETINQARSKLESIINSLSPKQPHCVQLQEVLVLLDQACDIQKSN